MKDKNKIQVRDDKLLKNEKSWRRARVGVLIFTVVWLSILYITFKSSSTSKEEKGVLFFLIGWSLFWMLLFDWLNMKIRHIDSIKCYREMISELKCDKSV